jgi:hypothetical protein
MIKRMVQKWLGLEETTSGSFHGEVHQTTESILHESGPVISAYRIANGYVLRTTEYTDPFTNVPKQRVPMLTFCKDHKEIADHIVVEATKATLGVGQQYQLPLTFNGKNAI